MSESAFVYEAFMAMAAAATGDRVMRESKIRLSTKKLTCIMVSCEMQF